MPTSPTASAHTTDTVDVAVVGAGTAGLAAWRAASEHTPRVMLIESGHHGTTCARVGCMPSKLLIAAAEAAHHARHASPFGVMASVSVDGRAVMNRVRSERDRFVGFVLDSVQRIDPSQKLHGHAKFTAPGVLDIDGRTLRARSVVIATGSSPFVPKTFANLGDRLVINDDVFSWHTLPASVVVFGTGVIGLELGQALARLGVRVRLFGRGGTVGPLTDPGVREALLTSLRSEVPIDPDATVHSIKRVGDKVEVTFEQDGRAVTESFEYLLAATGRRPNLSGLDLHLSGVTLDEKNRPKHSRDTLLAEGAPVFFAGDVTDDVPLLHEAADEGRIAGDNAGRYPDIEKGFRRSLLAVVFTEPQVAIVGEGFSSLSKRTDFHQNVVVGEIDFSDQGRSRVILQNRGLGRVYADRVSGRFLGAELVGPRAEHLGHLLAWAHQQGLTVPTMLSMPFYHPVIEEGLRTALRDAAKKLSTKTSQPLGA